MLNEHFQWKGLVKDVSFFVDRCLHCAGATGVLKRPLGSAIHWTKPNDIINWDFVAIQDGYLLVMKDDASQFLMLHEAKAATARVTAGSLTA
jgi:hypothetical protein